MFQKIGEAFRRFMYGRYGTDSLNKALLIAAVVLMLLGWAGGSWIASWMTIFNLFAYVPLIWCIFICVLPFSPYSRITCLVI